MQAAAAAATLKTASEREREFKGAVEGPRDSAHLAAAAGKLFLAQQPAPFRSGCSLECAACETT